VNTKVNRVAAPVATMAEPTQRRRRWRDHSVLEPNTTVTITVVYSNPTAGNVYINGWIDFNQDGTMGAGEQIITDTVVAPGGGTVLIPVAVPANANRAMSLPASASAVTSGLTMMGLASDGEVEDYIALVPQ
jgi:hypothetical protein